jgi:hypothetical protein
LTGDAMAKMLFLEPFARPDSSLLLPPRLQSLSPG